MVASLEQPKRYGQVFSKPLPGSIFAMNNQDRAKALGDYINGLRDGRKEFQGKTKYSKGRVTQLVNDGFGELAARKIAARLGLPADYFNQPRGPGALTADQAALVEAFDGLLPEQQAAVLKDITAKAAENRRAFEVLRERFDVKGVATDGQVAQHVGRPPREKQKATPPAQASVKLIRKK